MSCSTTEYGYTTDDGTHKQHQGRKNCWNTRNNSSNISAVLNSELHNSEYESNILNNLKKPVIVSNHCYKTCKIPKFHCEGCYCSRSPVYPKLTMKLLTKLVKLKKPKCKSRNMYCQHGCCCNQDRNHSTVSLENNSSLENKEIAKSIKTKTLSPQRTTRKAHETFTKKPTNVKQCHRVTQSQVHEQERHQAQQLHEASKSENSDDKNSVRINKRIRKKKSKISQVRNSSYFSPTITTISENEDLENGKRGATTYSENGKEDTTSLENEKEGTPEIINFPYMKETARLNTNINTDENLKNLNTFRKKNYFDCHSTGNLCEAKVSEHKCLHKFVLNDRLVPQPLYADVFGTSRCTECNKPIQSDIVHYNKDNAVTKDNTNYQTNVFRQSACCVDRQTKYKINISTNNDRIEIKVPISFEKYNDLFNTCFKIKNPISANSLALRHQKGVV